RRLEVVAHCVVNALFCAARVRAPTPLHVVQDGPGAPPKSVCLDGDGMGSLPGLDEVSIWRVLRQALEAGLLLELGQEVAAAPGVRVSKLSFEQLVRQRSACGPLYYLRPGGADIRGLALASPACFVLTDHLAMPRKSNRFLERLGAQPVSVGPRMLFASQCVAIVNNELDRLGID
ncbi:MAG: hypothetical protein AB1505_03155, partial [Candidatus Latescibacterota bacterium]